MNDLNNRSFVDEIRRGNTRAFQILFDRLAPMLCSFLGAEFGLCPHDAEEIASEAMFKVHRSVARFDPQGGAKLTTWVFEIAKRTAIDHLRKQTAQRRKAAAAAEAGDDPVEPEAPTEDSYEMAFPGAVKDNLPDRSSAMSDMRRAFDSISEPDRDILRMRRVMEYEDIAKVENISANAARVRPSRAEERLRDAYEKEKEHGQRRDL